LEKRFFSAYNRIHRKIFLFAFFLMLVFVLGIFLPFFICSSNIEICRAIYSFYGFTCHQLPWRSFIVFGLQIPVCARCISIQTVSLLAMAFFLPKKVYQKPFAIPFFLLLLLIAPVALDGLTQLSGLRESTNFLRLATGITYGLAQGIFSVWLTHFAASLIMFSKALFRRNKKEIVERAIFIKKLFLQ
jgi:uncharacterized membrane protein